VVYGRIPAGSGGPAVFGEGGCLAIAATAKPLRFFNWSSWKSVASLGQTVAFFCVASDLFFYSFIFN
jgi:hypothetical protein